MNSVSGLNNRTINPGGGGGESEKYSSLVSTAFNVTALTNVLALNANPLRKAVRIAVDEGSPSPVDWGGSETGEENLCRVQIGSIEIQPYDGEVWLCTFDVPSTALVVVTEFF